MAYEVYEEEVGILEKETIRTVHMDRVVFLTLVELTLRECHEDDDVRQRVRDEIMPTAKTMPRYPLGRWLTDRGCGCVVGEYLVAKAELEQVSRQKLLDKFNRGASIIDLLDDNPLGEELTRFGYAIDSALEDHVYSEHGLAEDNDGPYRQVGSIEFIDNNKETSNA